MKQIETIQDLKKYRNKIKSKESIGFVPTMGAIHDGHLSLIKKAKKYNDIVIVSIFVNPTQFLQGEDLRKYPRQLKEDMKKCKEAGVDLVFTPSSTQMYEANEPKVIGDKIGGYILEGATRPGHFDGVLTVVLKLFNLINPTNAYFGKKDAQQLILIEKMTKALFINVNIIPCELIREKDGLAMSSRNVYLSKDDREMALLIHKALSFGQMLITENNEKKTEVIIDEMVKILEPVEIEYVKITDRELNSIEEINVGNTIILIAVKVSNTRLIDNIWI